jgi:hypothetical protein
MGWPAIVYEMGSPVIAGFIFAGSVALLRID